MWRVISMTEHEWLNSADLESKLAHAPSFASNRKLLLFSCACCRRVWDKLDSLLCHPLVEAAERFADDLRHSSELTEIGQELWEFVQSEKAADRVKCWSAFGAAFSLRYAPSWSVKHTSIVANSIRRSVGTACPDLAIQEMQQQVSLLCDILGNPFRLSSFDPRWRTSSVLDLVQTTYASRSFDLMPILADALMDAGCADEETINHCRREGGHVRGCWVIDLTLGKS